MAIRKLNLTVETIKQNARIAYIEGRLGFQNGYDKCRYFYDDAKDTRCVIGASLPKSAKDWLGDTNDDTLNVLDKNRIKFEDKDWSEKLQQLHDGICQGDFLPGKERSNAIRRFRRMIGFKN